MTRMGRMIVRISVMHNIACSKHFSSEFGFKNLLIQRILPSRPRYAINFSLSQKFEIQMNWRKSRQRGAAQPSIKRPLAAVFLCQKWSNGSEKIFWISEFSAGGLELLNLQHLHLAPLSTSHKWSTWVTCNQKDKKTQHFNPTPKTQIW